MFLQLGFPCVTKEILATHLADVVEGRRLSKIAMHIIVEVHDIHAHIQTCMMQAECAPAMGRNRLTFLIMGRLLTAQSNTH